jgi:hypothetical protein
MKTHYEEIDLHGVTHEPWGAGEMCFIPSFNDNHNKEIMKKRQGIRHTRLIPPTVYFIRLLLYIPLFLVSDSEFPTRC